MRLIYSEINLGDSQISNKIVLYLLCTSLKADVIDASRDCKATTTDVECVAWCCRPVPDVKSAC